MTELDLTLEDGPHAPTATTDDPLDILAAGLERRRNKQLALASVTAVPLETWSTNDLVTERNRIRAVLDQAPPDRTADLAALERTRHDIEGRKRPRKVRHLPDFDLTTAKRNLVYFEKQADRLDHEIVTIHSSQHRRASHLVAHQAEQVELDAIGDVLRERLRQQTNNVVHDPPSYITKTLGPRPIDRDTDRIWVQAVVEVERYRMAHDITDGRSAIGVEPRENRSALAWRRACDEIEEARQHTTGRVSTTRGVERRSGADRAQGPLPDLGL